jgi:hypothetical protein
MGTARRPADGTLEQVVRDCQRAIADYRAGLLDEDELRAELERAGLVLSGSGATSEPGC